MPPTPTLFPIPPLRTARTLRRSRLRPALLAAALLLPTAPLPGLPLPGLPLPGLPLPGAAPAGLPTPAVADPCRAPAGPPLARLLADRARAQACIVDADLVDALDLVAPAPPAAGQGAGGARGGGR